MKFSARPRFLVVACLLLSALGLHGQSTLPQGILHSITNARITPTADSILLDRLDPATPITLHFTTAQALGVLRESDQWWILPTDLVSTPIHANADLWILPRSAETSDHSWHLQLAGTNATAIKTGEDITVTFAAPHATLYRAEARPHSDPFGHRFTIQINAGHQLEEALAAFYWGTMLPSIAEKTFAANFLYSSGYVLSTLNTQSYAGSYPAVDHEFQTKGRLAIASPADLDIVRRMIELQFHLMNDDPEHLFRSPTSVQPNGTREYHVRRDSRNLRENAAMFPLTASIEVVEESWRYFEASKSLTWLRTHIADLENAASWTQASIDPLGRVWSDVYYEDQVIKDGRETEAQAFAASSFQLLAKMETSLGRKARAAACTRTANKLAAALIAPLPLGFWDASHQRFIDWVDRNSIAHDHLPLLANTLPVTLGFATPTQAAAVRQLVQANAAQFERFPSFVAAKIEDYTDSEMGTAGPYDLSAAGRYWFWDAAYRATENENHVLLDQLKAVAAEGASTGYLMGERYDMDHVYFIDGKHAHGAERYYEYPNVYAAVLIEKLLGLSLPAEADVAVAPHLTTPATVEFNTPAYALRYTWDGTTFHLKNLAPTRRRFVVDLTALSSGGAARQSLMLAPQQEATWVPARHAATP